jgi:hypothetical protein
MICFVTNPPKLYETNEISPVCSSGLDFKSGRRFSALSMMDIDEPRHLVGDASYLTVHIAIFFKSDVSHSGQCSGGAPDEYQSSKLPRPSPWTNRIWCSTSSSAYCNVRSASAPSRMCTSIIPAVRWRGPRLPEPGPRRSAPGSPHRCVRSEHLPPPPNLTVGSQCAAPVQWLRVAKSRSSMTPKFSPAAPTVAAQGSEKIKGSRQKSARRHF